MKPHGQGPLGRGKNHAGRDGGLSVAAITLLQLAVGDLTTDVMTTVRTLETSGPTSMEESFETVLFGAALLKKLVQANALLAWDGIVWHGMSRMFNKLMMI